jgi:hypothetical protein
MTDQHDRDELVELMGRYARMADTADWDELPRSVFCDDFTSDFSSLGAPVATVSRENTRRLAAECRQADRDPPGERSSPSGSDGSDQRMTRRELLAHLGRLELDEGGVHERHGEC